MSISLGFFSTDPNNVLQFKINGTNYCGNGYSDKKFLKPGDPVTFESDGVNALDELCRTHDIETTSAMLSPTRFQDQLAADDRLLAAIGNAYSSGQFTSPDEKIQAALVLGAFINKGFWYTEPLAFQNNVQNLVADLLAGLSQGPNILRLLNSPEWATGSWTELSTLPSLNNPNWSPAQRLIDASAATRFTTAVTHRPHPTGPTTPAPLLPLYDPLSLDLDNDGLETIGINTASPILFDHTGSGVKIATGWLSSHDGFLALDRNGNGTIDNGTELFGDSTVLPDGNRAHDGFEALSAQDTNADGLVNAQDTAFAALRVWRDLNQNGISETNELQSLTTAGIASITVAKTENSVLLPNGNQLADLGSYNRTNGTVGDMGTAASMADIDLAGNPFFSDFVDTIPLTTVAQSLPDMQGSGLVRDLREAASLPTAEATVLASQLATYSAATTKAAQQALLPGLVAAWAATSSQAPHTGGLSTVTYGGGWVLVPAQGWRWYSTETVTPMDPTGSAYQQAMSDLNVAEAFNGQRLDSTPIVDGEGNPVTVRTSDEQIAFLHLTRLAIENSVYDSLALQTRLKPYLDGISLTISENGIGLDYSGMVAALASRKTTDGANAALDLADLIRLAPSQDVEVAGADVLTQWLSDPATRAPLYAALAADGFSKAGIWTGGQANELMIGDIASDTLSGGTGNDTLLGGVGNDALNGNADDDILKGGDGEDTLHGDAGNDLLFGDAGTDILYGDDGADTVNGGDGNDTLNGLTGDDTLNGDAGNDTLSGGVGNDGLYGNAGNDTLNGNNGDDTLYGEDDNDTLSGGDGNDTLDGGAGTDTLAGGTGNNSYSFGKGDGQDCIALSSDTTVGKLNTLVFKAGVAPSEIIGSRSGDDLVFAIAGTSDSITMTSFFFYDNPAHPNNPVQQARFADGTIWELATMTAMGFVVGSAASTTVRGSIGDDVIHAGGGYDVVNGMGGNDTLYGGTGYDTLNGNNGDDTLYGEDDNDTLSGGDGNDTLYGGVGDDALTGNAGNDSLDGGTGTDSLVGGTGNDTYQFGLGYGTDSITENDATVGNTDVARFMSGIATDQIWLRHVGNNLELSIIGTSDKLTIQNWYTGSAYHVEQFQTADNKQLLDTRVENLVQAMASFAPPAAGQTTLPQNYQDVLASVIAANWQ